MAGTQERSCDLLSKHLVGGGGGGCKMAVVLDSVSHASRQSSNATLCSELKAGSNLEQNLHQAHDSV